jgi:hypothetical protein
MAPIRSYLEEDAAFDDETTEAMGRAFENVCAALHVDKGDAASRCEIAARIIDLARGGMTDPAALTERVMGESKTRL